MSRERKSCRFGLWMTVILTGGLLFPFGGTAPASDLSRGELLYVPVYSHVYHGDGERPILLTAILSIRNTDPRHSITIDLADYYDTEGKLIRSYVTKPVTLKPLASTKFVVKESDTKGGSGASFLVRWKAEAETNPAIMEAVMIGAALQQGISFTSRGMPTKGK